MNWIIPMEPVSCHEVKAGSEYIHEIKWDGIRGLAYFQDNETKIFTKKGNERTDFYPEICSMINKGFNNDMVLDGEIVVFDKSGIPSFHSILTRETVRNKRNLQYYLNNYPVKYMIFDILQYKDNLLTKLPLEERKEILFTIVSSIGQNDIIRLSEVYTDGNSLFQKIKKQNMEGIVSKQINSAYFEAKKHNAWFKTKFTKKMLTIVGGIQWKDGYPNSLLLGIKNPDFDKLMFVGKASLGLKRSDLLLLKEYNAELSQDECPFEAEFISDVNMTGSKLTWMIPALTCWISFLELSNDGHFRHPKIAGFTSLSTDEANGRVYTD